MSDEEATELLQELVPELNDLCDEDCSHNVADILVERGSRYGVFKTHASIAQEIKKVIAGNSSRLSPSQREALDMIAHKMGRILNGDPDYADSWVDIAGYSQLIVAELEGVEV